MNVFWSDANLDQLAFYVYPGILVLVVLVALIAEYVSDVRHRRIEQNYQETLDKGKDWRRNRRG